MNTVTLAPSLRFVSSIEEIGRERWNALTGTSNPFTRYEFLHALETTGCTTAQSGWQPHHAVVYGGTEGSEGTGESNEDTAPVLAVMPLYLKTNSWGEYVFDWSWANAYQSYGFDYYPKFVTAVPFTPSFGRRIFIAQSQDQAALLKLIVEKTREKAEVLGASPGMSCFRWKRNMNPWQSWAC